MAKAKKSAATPTKNKTAAVVSTAVHAGGLPAGVTATRIITLPVLVLKQPGVGVVVKILDAMRESKVEGKKGADGKPQKPAIICSVVNVQTGEQFIFIVNAVIESNLKRDYPDDTYVGKTFYFENLGKRTTGQRYHDFRIAECEYDAQAAAAAKTE